MGNALIIAVDGARTRAYPLDTIIRVRTHLGAGRVVYLTSDACLGIQLDGEICVDEYAAEHLARAA